jgi:hypothetical protein
MTHILTTEQHWACPNCDVTEVTQGQPGNRFHNCAGLKGLTAPMVPAGTKCKVEAMEREDYVGKEVLTYDTEGRPITAVNVTRDDGNDVVVFAPCATARMVF